MKATTRDQQQQELEECSRHQDGWKSTTGNEEDWGSQDCRGQDSSRTITTTEPVFLNAWGPRNRFQGMNSASLCSLAGRYDNPLPPRILAPIDSLKIPAQISCLSVILTSYSIAATGFPRMYTSRSRVHRNLLGFPSTSEAYRIWQCSRENKPAARHPFSLTNNSLYGLFLKVGRLSL